MLVPHNFMWKQENAKTLVWSAHSSKLHSLFIVIGVGKDDAGRCSGDRGAGNDFCPHHLRLCPQSIFFPLHALVHALLLQLDIFCHDSIPLDKHITLSRSDKQSRRAMPGGKKVPACGVWAAKPPFLQKSKEFHSDTCKTNTRNIRHSCHNCSE